MSQATIEIADPPKTINAARLAKELGSVGVKVDPENITTGPTLTIVYESEVEDAEALIREVVAAHAPPAPETDGQRIRRLAKAALTQVDSPDRLLLLGVLQVLYQSIAEVRTKVGLPVRPWAAMLDAVRKRIDEA